jgi:hypothetical protein
VDGTQGRGLASVNDDSRAPNAGSRPSRAIDTDNGRRAGVSRLGAAGRMGSMHGRSPSIQKTRPRPKTAKSQQGQKTLNALARSPEARQHFENPLDSGSQTNSGLLLLAPFDVEPKLCNTTSPTWGTLSPLTHGSVFSLDSVDSTPVGSPEAFASAGTFSPSVDMYGWDAEWLRHTETSPFHIQEDAKETDTNARKSGILQRVFGVGAHAPTGQ